MINEQSMKQKMRQEYRDTQLKLARGVQNWERLIYLQERLWVLKQVLNGSLTDDETEADIVESEMLSENNKETE